MIKRNNATPLQLASDSTSPYSINSLPATKISANLILGVVHGAQWQSLIAKLQDLFPVCVHETFKEKSRFVYTFHKYVGEREEKTLIPSYWSKRELPSLARMKRPPFPLEIRRSSSRYVIISQELVLSLGIGIFSGGWPEMACDMPSTTSCRGLRDCCTGERLRFWPKMLTFSGSSILDFISGGCIAASLNITCLH